MKNRAPHKIRKIRSFHDLEKERTRLEMEVLRKEEQIKSGYRHIVDILTLRNLLHRLSTEISITTSAVSSAFSLGKSIFKKFRKKKKDKDKPSEVVPPVAEPGMETHAGNP